MQGTQVQSLVQKDPICQRTINSTCSRAWALQQEKPWLDAERQSPSAAVNKYTSKKKIVILFWIYIPKGLNLHSQQWKCEVLTSGPPGNCQECVVLMEFTLPSLKRWLGTQAQLFTTSHLPWPLRGQWGWSRYECMVLGWCKCNYSLGPWILKQYN